MDIDGIGVWRRRSLILGTLLSLPEELFRLEILNLQYDAVPAVKHGLVFLFGMG
jgi:hypothetical protein